MSPQNGRVPYYLASFEKPLAGVFSSHKHLWTEEETTIFQLWNEAVPLNSKKLFVRLASRRSQSAFRISHIESRYLKDLTWDSPDVSDSKIELSVCLTILASLGFGTFITRDSQIDKCTMKDLVKMLSLSELRQLIKTKPMPPSIDPKQVLRKITRKGFLSKWLLQQASTTVFNSLTKKSAFEIVASSLLGHLCTPDSPDSPSIFCLNKKYARFFQRLHLISHLFSFSSMQERKSDHSDDEALESVMSQVFTPTLLTEITALEYFDFSRACFELKYSGPVFFNRAELEEYELSLAIAQRSNILAKSKEKDSDTTKTTALQLFRKCVSFLLAHVRRLDPAILQVWPADVSSLTTKFIELFPTEEKTEAYSIPDAEDEKDSEDSDSVAMALDTDAIFQSFQIQGVSSDDRVTCLSKLEHPFLRRFAPEYMYASSLCELSKFLESIKLYDPCVLAYEVLMLSGVLRSKVGKVLLRLFIDARLHLQNQLKALQWGLCGMRKAHELGPGVAIDLAKKVWKLWNRCQQVDHKGTRKRRKVRQDPITTEIIEVTSDSESRSNLIDLHSYKDSSYRFAQGYYRFLYAKHETPSNHILPVNSETLSRPKPKDQESLALCRTLANIETSIRLPTVIFTETRLPIVTPSSPPTLEHEDKSFVTPRKGATSGKLFNRSRYVGESSLVTVEQIALDAYMTNKKREAKNKRLVLMQGETWIGCHCEGSLIREFTSILLFPLFFHSNVCSANQGQFFSVMQEGPADLNCGNLFYSRRQEDICVYLELLAELNKQELLLLLVWACAHLYEIRLPNCKWMKDEQYPNVFQPILNFSSVFVDLGFDISFLEDSTETKSALRKTPTSKWSLRTSTPHSYSPHFYSNKKREIADNTEPDPVLGYHRHIKFMRQDWFGSLTPAERDERARYRRRISGMMYGLQLGWSCLGLAGERLGVFAFHLLQDWVYWSSGLPDLHLWSPQSPCGGKHVLSEDVPPTLSISLKLLVLAFINFDRRFLPPELVDLLRSGSLAKQVEQLRVDLPENEWLSESVRTELNEVWKIVQYVDVEQAQTKLVEVKGPGDTLSQKQKLWLYNLDELVSELCVIKDG